MPIQNNVLIVEDEILIGMAVMDDLVDISRPMAVATEAEALVALREEDIRFAIVDYHLKQGTSQGVIAALKERGIPFVVWTSSNPTVEDGALEGLPQLSKPYLTDELRQVVSAALWSAQTAANDGLAAPLEGSELRA